jgi:prepilin-type N-terminal cleavage/methylation domain-containing protein
MSRAQQRAEAGYTLTEVLVAVVILGVAVVAIVGALGTSIFSSRVHRNLVTGDAAARAYASQISQAGYVNCATPAGGVNPYPVMANAPAGMTVAVSNISLWTGSSSAGNFGGTSGPGCSDLGVQQITIVATPTAAGGGQSLTFVKRSP